METFLLRLFDLLFGWWRDRRQVRVRVHQAVFLPSSPEHYFVNVTNMSRDRDVEVTHVWFATTPPVHIINPQRPLPTRLQHDEPWETWIPVDAIPAAERPRALWLARVQLSTDKVVDSRPRRNVPPVGGIPGGDRR